nr:hypothetical protein [Clostridia bacterium]
MINSANYICPNCGAPYSPIANRCDYCGTWFGPLNKEESLPVNKIEEPIIVDNPPLQTNDNKIDYPLPGYFWAITFSLAGVLIAILAPSLFTVIWKAAISINFPADLISTGVAVSCIASAIGCFLFNRFWAPARRYIAGPSLTDYILNLLTTAGFGIGLILVVLLLMFILEMVIPAIIILLIIQAIANN